VVFTAVVRNISLFWDKRLCNQLKVKYLSEEHVASIFMMLYCFASLFCPEYAGSVFLPNAG
jgi:hypothetical protein